MAKSRVELLTENSKGGVEELLECYQKSNKTTLPETKEVSKELAETIFLEYPIFYKTVESEKMNFCINTKNKFPIGANLKYFVSIDFFNKR